MPNARTLLCFLPAEQKYDGVTVSGGIYPYETYFDGPQQIPVSNGSGEATGTLIYIDQGGDRGFYEEAHLTTRNIQAFGDGITAYAFGAAAQDIVCAFSTQRLKTRDTFQRIAAGGLKNEDANVYASSNYAFNLVTVNPAFPPYVDDHIYLDIVCAADGVDGYESPFAQTDPEVVVGPEYATWTFDLGLFTNAQLTSPATYGIILHKDKSGNDYQVSVVSSLFTRQTFNMAAHPVNTTSIAFQAPRVANTDLVSIGAWAYQDLADIDIDAQILAQGTEWLTVSQYALVDGFKGV